MASSTRWTIWSTSSDSGRASSTARGCSGSRSRRRAARAARALGLPYPRRGSSTTRPRRAAAAEGLRFPVVVKANIGGSGAGIVRYDSPEALAAAAERAARSISASTARRWCRSSCRRAAGTSRASRRSAASTSTRSRSITAGGLVQPLPGRRLPDHRRRRARAAAPAPSTRRRPGSRSRATRRRRRSSRDVERIFAAARDRRRRHRVHHRRSRRQALLYYDINALSNFVAEAAETSSASIRARRGSSIILEAAIGREQADAIRLLAAGVRRLAAQRRRRGHGRDVGLRAAARAAQRGDRLRPHARSPS